MESFMRIHGLQKMTLLDFPGHVACTVFLGGCDLRCPYCHNYELATGQAPAVMEEEELFAFLAKRKGLLDGVAITGGVFWQRGRDFWTALRSRAVSPVFTGTFRSSSRRSASWDSR